MRREMVDEPRHYRLIVSPEDPCGRQIDMQEFAREFMSRVEADYSRQFHWVASAHYNTDHPHLHIGIRGMDTKMEPVLFHEPYQKNGFKRRAREILYERLGSAKELRRAG
jgi:type IV secretory pathway VirD2 relaxase